MLNCLQNSSLRPGAQHRHILQLQGKCLGPQQTVLEVTPQQSSSDLRGAEEAQYTVGKNTTELVLPGSKLHWIKHEQIFFLRAHLMEEFWFAWIKKEGINLLPATTISTSLQSNLQLILRLTCT